MIRSLYLVMIFELGILFLDDAKSIIKDTLGHGYLFHMSCNDYLNTTQAFHKC